MRAEQRKEWSQGGTVKPAKLCYYFYPLTWGGALLLGCPKNYDDLRLMRLYNYPVMNVLYCPSTDFKHLVSCIALFLILSTARL